MRYRAVLLATVPFMLGGLPMAAHAQAAVEAQADSGDIIVTARKRQESILKVPVIQSVLTRDQLERNQVTDLYDIASLTPGIILGGGALEIGTQISIRGVGTSALDPGIDQSISLNLDGQQFSQGSAFSVGVFDMAQVEVLKGPQALFFGKNSPGGVISIRTADPGSELEVVGSTGYEFEAREWRTDMILSGPVSDTLGLRLAARYADLGGYFKNDAVPDTRTGAVAPPRRFGATKTLYLRGSAVFKPAPEFSARLKLNYTRDRNIGGVAQQLTSCPDGLGSSFVPIAGFPGLQFFSPREDCLRDRNLSTVFVNPAAFPNVPKGGRIFLNTSQRFGVLEMNYDPSPEISLTSVTGVYRLKVHADSNAGNTGSAAPAIIAEKRFGRREFTQEVRLNSSFAGPLNFSGGLFYQDAELKNNIILHGNLLYGRPATLQTGTHDIDIKSVSAFGQLRYKIAPEFEIAGGVRWTDEKRSDTARTVIAGVNTLIPVPNLRTKNWSPELTLTYTPTDDLTIFGSLKQGYKSGSYNIIVPLNPGQNNRFGDEKVQGGEVGLKARLADRQIYTNLAFYLYKYKGLQVGANETSVNGLPLIRTINAGSSKVYGVDFDMSYKPQSVPGLSLNGAVNWNRAKFTNFANAPCYGGQTIAEGCNLFPIPNTTPQRFNAQDLSGTPLNRAPRWQANLGFSYEMPMGGDMTLAFGGDTQISSKYKSNLGRRADFFQKAFAKLNATVTVKGPGEGWEISLIGNNLSNELTSGTCTNTSSAGANISGIITGGPAKGVGGSDEVVCALERGRELWIRLTLRPTALFGR